MVSKIQTFTLPFTVSFHNAVMTKEGEIFIIGGQDRRLSYKEAYSREVYKLTYPPFRVEHFATMGFSRAHADSVLIEPFILTAGGTSTGTEEYYTAAHSICRIDTRTGEIKEFPLLSQEIYDGELVPLKGDEIVLVGGWRHIGGREYGTTNYLGHFRVDHNGEVSLVREGRLHIERTYRNAHVISNNRIAIIGGYYSPLCDPRGCFAQRNLDTIEIYHSQTGRIEMSELKLPPLPQSEGFLGIVRKYQHSVRIGDRIYLFGGTQNPKEGRGMAVNKVDVVDFEKNAVYSAAPIRIPRYHFNTMVLEKFGRKYVLLLGGGMNDATLAINPEIYDIEKNVSYLLEEIDVHSLDHDRISIPDGNKIWLIGGDTIEAPVGLEIPSNKVYLIEFDEDTTASDQEKH